MCIRDRAWVTAQCHHDYSRQLMVTLLKEDMPCVFRNLYARNRPSSPIKPFDLKSGPICIKNKPAFYIGNLTSPAKHDNNLEGRYEITTDLGKPKCTIMCKKEHICMHQENSEIMNQLIADCRAGWCQWTNRNKVFAKKIRTQINLGGSSTNHDTNESSLIFKIIMPFVSLSLFMTFVISF